MSARPIPESELAWTFVTSSGPGGQNVNKTASKVQLRWHLPSSSVFNEQEKLLLQDRLASRLTEDGFLAIDRSESRSQLANKRAATRELDNLIEQALKPVKKRRPTKPSKTSKLRRRKLKQERSQIKRSRQRFHVDL